MTLCDASSLISGLARVFQSGLPALIPEHVLVDSNLRLGAGPLSVARLHSCSTALRIPASRRVFRHGGSCRSGRAACASAWISHERRPGWIAASETYLAGEWVRHRVSTLAALRLQTCRADRTVDVVVAHRTATGNYHGLVAALSPMKNVRPGAGS